MIEVETLERSIAEAETRRLRFSRAHAAGNGLDDGLVAPVLRGVLNALPCDPDRRGYGL